jgi:ABC-type xylose transport system permease subunit
MIVAGPYCGALAPCFCFQLNRRSPYCLFVARSQYNAYIKIPSFIATLAGMLIFRGLTLVLLRGQSIGPFPGEFQALSSGFIPDIFGSGGLRITTLVIGAIISIIWMCARKMRTALHLSEPGDRGRSRLSSARLLRCQSLMLGV